MPFRATSTALRRLCGLVLLAWLFGVLSGTVNACVLADQTPDQSPSAPTKQQHHHAHAHGHEAAHEHEHTQPVDHQADEHVLCHKFCKDQSLTLPHHKGLGAQDFSPALIALSGPVLPPEPAIPPTARWMDGPQAQGPPLVIRLLRLTL